jgi:UDP:flavonoid glycosyltransferase YjiC (YdhE family)
LALELKHRGHSVMIASTEFYREKVEGLGIEFHPMRPNWQPNDSELIRQCEDLKSGPEVLFRKLILPHLKDTYADLLSAAAGADLMIAGELVYAAPLVAEKLELPWVSAILSPCSFFSAHDPSVLVNMPGLIRLRRAGWAINRAALDLGRRATRHWWNPIRHLRREQGLRPDCDPLFRDKFSPDLVLALFSRWLAQAQPDWPAQTLQPGFVYYDRVKLDADDSPHLRAFLASGDAPIVFTLGSTAVHNPGDFYETSVQATKQLGRRAVLLGANTAPALVSPEILALPYAPYSQIFPHAAVIVHQGGSGTTGQALRAARPMLVVPYGWDQPDNGARVERLGAGLCLSRNIYSAKTAATVLNRLLTDLRFAARTAEVGARLRQECGSTMACDAIESTLERVGNSRATPIPKRV